MQSLTVSRLVPRLWLRIQTLSTAAALKSDSREAAKPFSAIPGPRSLPLLGNTREVSLNAHRFNQYLDDCFRKYGELFKLKFFGTELVFLKNPDILENILRAEGKYPVRDIHVTREMFWLYKNKANRPPPSTLQDGEHWKRLRNAMNKQTLPKNVKMYSASFNEIFQKFINHIKTNNGSITGDLHPHIMNLFLQVSAKLVLGTDMDPKDDQFAEFLGAVDTQVDLFTRLYRELPLYKLYNNKLAKEFKEAIELTRAVVSKEMDKLYSTLESGEEKEVPCILEQWLKEGKLTEEEAITEAVSIFSASVHTSTNQTSFLLYLLAKNPEVQERLYEELCSVLGEATQATAEQLSQLPFLKMCLLESYRLLSTAPAYTRVLKEDSVFHGYEVPKNTTVMYSIYSAGRDEKLFHDPLNFDPERWKRDDTHAFAILPFGFGPRACYGRRFAELEMKLLCAQVIRNFKISTSIKDLKVINKAVLVPGEPLTIKFEERLQ